MVTYQQPKPKHLIGPQEELRSSSGYNPGGFTSLPGREAKYGFPGFITTNKQTTGIPRGFQGLFTPCPWDTHYQFSIKLLLSKPGGPTPCLLSC